MGSTLDKLPAMSLMQALLSANPIAEVMQRLKYREWEELTPAERMFEAAVGFLCDTRNGCLDQSLWNSTSDHWTEIHEFVQCYGGASLQAVIADIAACFPGGEVPSDRAVRIEALDGLGEEGEQKLGDLTRRFYALTEDYEDGLIRLLTESQDQWAHYHRE